MQTVRTLERERQLTVLGDTLFEGWQMKRMRRVAIISTTFSMFDLFFILNTWLVLPAVARTAQGPLVSQCLTSHSPTTLFDCRCGCGQFSFGCSPFPLSQQSPCGSWPYSSGGPK